MSVPGRAGSVGGGPGLVEPAFDVRPVFGESVHLGPVRGHRVLEPVVVGGRRLLEPVHAPVLAGGGVQREPGEGEADREHGADGPRDRSKSKWLLKLRLA